MSKILPFFALLLLLTSCSDELTFAEQLNLDKSLIRAYLQENNIDADSTATGIYFIVEEEGIGTTMPNSFSDVLVTYKGYYTNGDVFDENENVAFNLARVISGWQQGIPLFKKDGKGKLFIPSGYGYGVNGNQSIPGNTVLIFDIHLKDFE